jgi:hypothetical protein
VTSFAVVLIDDTDVVRATMGRPRRTARRLETAERFDPVSSRNVTWSPFTVTGTRMA